MEYMEKLFSDYIQKLERNLLKESGAASLPTPLKKIVKKKIFLFYVLFLLSGERFRGCGKNIC